MSSRPVLIVICSAVLLACEPPVQSPPDDPGSRRPPASEKGAPAHGDPAASETPSSLDSPSRRPAASEKGAPAAWTARDAGGASP
jgi:hypothetical protein